MDDQTRASYDKVAAEYARHLSAELDGKPLDRQLLAEFATSVVGAVADIGCGPGHVTRYLRECGAEVIGIDLSPAMITEAQIANPSIPFVVADMRALPLADASLGGIVAFYSLIHIPETEHPAVLQEWHRVIQPGGRLLVSFHRGEESRHFDEWWGEQVNLDFRFFMTEAVVVALTEAGFSIDAVVEREPYPEIEVQTQRVYISASVL